MRKIKKKYMMKKVKCQFSVHREGLMSIYSSMNMGSI